MKNIEAKLVDSDPNGLSEMLKGIIDPNLKDPGVYEEVKEWDFTATVTESTSNVSSSIIFREGEVSVKNGDLPEAEVKMKANFQTLSDVGSGGLLTGLKAMLLGKLKREGSFFKLLKLQKVISA